MDNFILKENINDRFNSCIISSCSTWLLVIFWRRRMNQKFGDLFQKFLVIFFVWTCIAFIFGIGY